jgi:hypothetical protein
MNKPNPLTNEELIDPRIHRADLSLEQHFPKSIRLLCKEIPIKEVLEVVNADIACHFSHPSLLRTNVLAYGVHSQKGAMHPIVEPIASQAFAAQAV